MVALHPQLTHVAPLLGTWNGQGHGEYPTIDSFDYVESITFDHVGKPFLRYEQRTRRIEADGSLGPPFHAESGYWRFPSPGRVEVVLSHPTGINEIEEGTVTTEPDGSIVVELATTSVHTTGSAMSVTALGRAFHVTAETISYRLSMAAVGLPLQHHLAAELRREPDSGTA